MKFVFIALALLGGLFYWMIMGEPSYTDTVIEEIAVNGSEGLLQNVPKARVDYDYDVTSDGNGSLRVDATGSVLVNLFDVWGEEVDLSFRQLVYEAKVRKRLATG